jgi:hypothetical protein
MANCRGLTVGIGVLIVGATAWSAVAAGADPINWNERAASQVLNRKSLEGLTPVTPRWKVRQMVWPPEAELRPKRADATDKQRSECMQWLAKYLNATQIPPGLENHLVALQEWDAWDDHDIKETTDVFLVRIQKGPQVIQIEETLSTVVIIVGNDRLATQRRSDHAQFVGEVSASLLQEPLRPILSSSRFYATNLGAGKDGTKISRVSWPIESVLVRDANGKEAMSHAKAVEVGTVSVEAETDGRFVRFELRKHVDAPGVRPFVRRFAPNTK